MLLLLHYPLQKRPRYESCWVRVFAVLTYIVLSFTIALEIACNFRALQFHQLAGRVPLVQVPGPRGIAFDVRLIDRDEVKILRLVPILPECMLFGATGALVPRRLHCSIARLSNGPPHDLRVETRMLHEFEKPCLRS